jgi:hypothetical protein
MRVGVSTGLGLSKTFVGVATEINFVGYGVTISAVYNAGIASVTFDATAGGTGSPGLPLNSVQYNSNGFFKGSPNLIFDGNNLYVSNSIGINNGTPTAKLDIIASSTEALRLRSTSGSGNILRIDNSLSDILGINTVTAIAPLDVIGDAAITGSVRLYNNARSFYVGLQPPTLTSNINLTLPPVVGVANSVLYTTGSGILNWISPQSLVALGLTSTDALIEGSVNLYFTNERAQDAVGAAINAGIQTGITVTYDDVNNCINFNNAAATPYPFTTKGFSIPF